MLGLSSLAFSVACDDDGTSSDNDRRDSGHQDNRGGSDAGDEAEDDGGLSDAGNGGLIQDPPDAGDGGPTQDGSEGGTSAISDGGLDCASGWEEVELYTEQGCSSSVAPTRVCAPQSWDAGCLLICGCDGQTYCASVWGSSQDWSHGLGVPFTTCDTDAG